MTDGQADTQPRRVRRRSERGEEPEFGRFAFFTDAVFAIALTLLVLDIRIDAIPGGETSVRGMSEALGDIAPNLVAFGVAFILLGRYWMAHHSFVARLAAVDLRLMGLNLLYLAFVALLPFPSSLVGEHESNPLSVIVFALVLAIILALETALYVDAHRSGLLRVVPSPDEYKWTVIGSTQPVVMFIITLPLAFVSTTLTLLSWITLGPIIGRTMSWLAPDDVTFEG